MKIGKRMRAGVLFHKLLLVLLLLVVMTRGNAQQCDPLAKAPTVDYRLTYDPVTQQFTAWFVPSISQGHRLVNAQFTIIAPNGYTAPQNSAGRDSGFNITGINGSWSDFVFDNELFATGPSGTIASVNGLAVHQVGMAKTAVDITTVTAGTPVPLFSFPASGCAGQLRVLVNNEPLRNDIRNTYGSNVNNSISIQTPIEQFTLAQERYCKNAPESQVNIVLPDVQNLTITECSPSGTYTGKFFEQALRNWNPTNLPAGTVVATPTKWGSFTVTASPTSAASALTIDPTSGQYSLTYPKVGGVTQPGSVTVTNTIIDNCNNQKTVQVVLDWTSCSGPVPRPPVLTGDSIITVVDKPGRICIPVSDPDGTTSFTVAICGQPTNGTATTPTVVNGNQICIDYTPPAGFTGNAGSVCIVVTDPTGLTATTTIPIRVNPITPVCPTISAVIPTNPSSCTAQNGSITLTGLTANQTYAVCFSRNGAAPACQPLPANANGRIVLSNLAVGTYTNITVEAQGCVSTPVSATLTGDLPAPTDAACSLTAVCAGQAVTLTASGQGIQWSGPGLVTTTGNRVTAIPTTPGLVTYTAVQVANGCISPPATATVVVKPVPSVSVVTTTNPACGGTDGSITLGNLTAGQSFTVCYTKDGAAPICSTQQASANGRIVISGLAAGVYNPVIVTENGCTSLPVSATLTSSGLTAPTIAVSPATAVCLGQPISLTATGQPGASFRWTGNGLSSTTGSVVTATPSSTGNLVFSVIQTINGCTSTSATIGVTVNPVPSVSSLAKTNPTACDQPNGTITLSGLSPTQPFNVCYRVNNSNPVCVPLTATLGGQVTLSGLTSGAYSLTVTASGGCPSSPLSTTLTGPVSPPQPGIAVAPSSTICLGQTVTLTASGNGTFRWSGVGLSSTSGSVVTVTPTEAGPASYSLVSTANGCVSPLAVTTIQVNTAPAPTVVTSTPPTACSGTDGSLTLGSLTAGRSYTICYAGNTCQTLTANASGQLTLTGLAANSYSLTVTAAGGCSAAAPVAATVTSSSACVQCVEAPLVIVQSLLLCQDATKTVQMQVQDADVNEVISASVCGVSVSGATASVSFDRATNQLSLTYKAAPGFNGLDQVCVLLTDKCGLTERVFVPVQIIRCVCIDQCLEGQPPIVIPQPIVTPKNNPQTVCVPISDAPGDTHTYTICANPQHGTAVVTINNQTHELCVTYTPNTDYVGPDKICVTVCDQTNRCTTVNIPVLVYGDKPLISPVSIVTNCSSSTTASMPIVDRDSNENHTVKVITAPENGTVTATVNNQTNQVNFTYTPRAGFEGSDRVIVEITDESGLTSTAEIPLYVNPGTCCTTVELKVMLEGPFDAATGLMKTTLNQRGLLPGQTPIGQFAQATPAGQPYNSAPWNYTGTESITTYDSDIVDWVLVSLRSDSLTTTSAFRVAGLLHSDGRISFVQPCFRIPSGSYFAVVEHRNHMGVMSPRRVQVINSRLTFDFTQQDSYTIQDPPSFGQIQIGNRWLMYSGEGKKEAYIDNFDINFSDSQLWKTESGYFDQYRRADYNMDADVNFLDSVLWKKNNGRYSKVPH